MTEPFDLERYIRSSRPLDLSDVAWRDARRHRLSGVEARCLTHLVDAKSRSLAFARDVLATRAGYEPAVTAFMSCWIYEEFWHGQACSRLLAESGFTRGSQAAPTTHRWRYPAGLGRGVSGSQGQGRRTRFGQIATAMSSLAMPDIAALRMTLGAMNELSAVHRYLAQIAKSRNPALIDILTRVADDDRRHLAFFCDQARARLGRSRQTRAAVRRCVESMWTPAGPSRLPQLESDFTIVALFDDVAGRDRLRRLDDTIGALPGFDGTTLAADALEAALSRLPAHRSSGCCGHRARRAVTDAGCR